MVSIAEVKSDIKPKQRHIRPKLRVRKNTTSESTMSTSVDDLIEKTRSKLTSALDSPSTSSQEDERDHLITDAYNRIVPRKNGIKPEPFLFENGKSGIESDKQVKPKGILKKPSSKPLASKDNLQTASTSEQNHQRLRDLENDTLADELGIPEEPQFDRHTGEKPTIKSFVKEQVVERSVKDWARKQPKTNKGAARVDDNIKDDTSPDQPTIIKSLSKLVALGQDTTKLSEDVGLGKKKSGQDKSPEDNGNTEGKPFECTGSNCVETRIEFSCMTQEEYDLFAKEAELLGLSIEEHLRRKQEEAIQDNEDDIISDDISKAVDEDKHELGSENGGAVFENHYNSDDNVEGDFLDFFANDDLGEEVLPPPPIRPFMLLWNALSDWITYEAVAILRKHKSELFVSRDDECREAVSLKSKSNEEVSDIPISRCAGLMNMLKMNLTKSLDDLGYNGEDGYTRRIAEGRLSEFVQCFDFSKPMVKFQTDMYRALTIVLLNIVLPRHDIAYEGQAGIIVKDETPPNEILLPCPLSDIGITIEEYRYLVNSAIPMLDIGSGG